MKYKTPKNIIPSKLKPNNNKENLLTKIIEDNHSAKPCLSKSGAIQAKYTNNYITIRYKINKESNNIKIFGRDFINNNKSKCNFIYNNKFYKLMEYFDYNECYKFNDILEIKLIGINDITNLSYMFSNCTSLISLPDINKLNTSNITDVSYMFNNCNMMKFLPDISEWDTSNIVSMEGLFKSCKSLLNLPDISLWDTSNVINMSYMFCNCESISLLPDISKWNVSKVKDMTCMFINCKSLTFAPDLSKWNLTANEEVDIRDIFYNCISLSFLPMIKVKIEQYNDCDFFGNCFNVINNNGL